MSQSDDSQNDLTVKVSPVKHLAGEMRVPGDKSVSHRAAMIASLAQGRSVITNFSSAADCQSTIDCIGALGVPIERDGATVIVEGVGMDGLKESAEVLNANNSGTTIRLLSGILAGQPFRTMITGDESLRSRPMSRIATPLREMGASVELEPNGCAPVRIEGRRPLRAIHYKLPMASAQVKSAVLLAGLMSDGKTVVEEPVPTRDHTERMLRGFGVAVEREGNNVWVNGGARLTAQDFRVPGDISSAAFFIATAVMLPGSNLVIRDVGLNPTRTAYLSVIGQMGADITVEDERIECGEPVGTLRIKGNAERRSSVERAVEVAGPIVPNLIDELPMLAFAAAATGTRLEVRAASELRVKESDRIAATAENLRRMGAQVEEREDGWIISNTARLKGARLESYGDHRIAMACAIAALTADGPSEIEGAKNAVSVSLPEFWSLLESVAE